MTVTITASLRPEVTGFAVMMETVLAQNDWKGGWQDMDYDEIIERIDQELNELKAALRPAQGFLSAREREVAKKEAVDVANFCMMLLDLL